MLDRLLRMMRPAPPQPQPRFVRLGREHLDPTSSTWRAVATWAEDEIARLRVRNDALSNLPDETAAIRGEIRALKRLLALTRPPVVPPRYENPDE